MKTNVGDFLRKMAKIILKTNKIIILCLNCCILRKIAIFSKKTFLNRSNGPWWTDFSHFWSRTTTVAAGVKTLLKIAEA
jgi:hypothetical protein